MARKTRSAPGLFGDQYHYENGEYVGKSAPGLFGDTLHYDSNGHYIGKSAPGLFGDQYHYDAQGHRVGKSVPGLFGTEFHTDERGNDRGHSFDGGLWGTSHTFRDEVDEWNNEAMDDWMLYAHSSLDQNRGCCYVATCVYGSYNCPEVWTLRRFRDGWLAKSRAGRAFIRLYYAVSPRIVATFGDSAWFKRLWHGPLDRLVGYCRKRGLADTPYDDVDWRAEVLGGAGSRRSRQA